MSAPSLLPTGPKPAPEPAYVTAMRYRLHAVRGVKTSG